MPHVAPNYFRYFASTAATELWGLALTASGYTKIPARSNYPPTTHPADHHFSWEQGRVLEALQIVLITGGRGTFESRLTGEIEATAGTAFALVPGVWHRYRPDPHTGWEESWIEVQGPTVERLLKAGEINVKATIRRDALQAGLDVALDAVHDRARAEPSGYDAELTARGYAVLAAWTRQVPKPEEAQRTRRMVAEAERFLIAHHTEAINVSDLAREFGMAYSHFRRTFSKHTGYAPWQYVLRLRLDRARRLLASGDATLEEMAEKLGFSSAFHLSTAFKQAHGKSPDQWRKELWQGQGAPSSGAR